MLTTTSLRISLLAAACLAPWASAQKQLSTLYATNNGLSAGAIAFFDLNVTSPTGATITALAINTNTTTTFEVDVYITPTTYVGKDTNGPAWTLVRTGKGYPMPQDTPSIVTFTPPLPFATGTYGIGIHYRTVYLKYTNGTGSNQSYSNADLGLTLGTGRSALWAGSVFSPRVWNGTIFYDTTPNPASFVAWGPGCAGSNGTPAMAAATGSAPKLGGTLQLAYTSLPLAAGPLTLILGASRASYASQTLPLSLAFLGMTGCNLYTSLDLTTTGVNTGGSGLAGLSIPPTTSLLGQEVFLQTFVPDALASGFPARMTNAAQAVIGL